VLRSLGAEVDRQQEEDDREPGSPDLVAAERERLR